VGIKCKFCGKNFDSENALKQHFNDVHKVDKGDLDINDVKNRGISRKAALSVIGVVVIAAVVIFSFIGSHNIQNSNAHGTGIGEIAPNIPITLANGTNITLSSLRGKPVILWFATTWCSSCQEGASLLANDGYYSKIHAKGADIVTIEVYNDFGYIGPSIQKFANQYGNGTNDNGWLYGTSDLNATSLYDPKDYLDIYYIINPNGTIVSSAPGIAANL